VKISFKGAESWLKASKISKFPKKSPVANKVSSLFPASPQKVIAPFYLK
jgi:hypothetical protein